MPFDNPKAVCQIPLRQIEETVATQLGPGRVPGNAAASCLSRIVGSPFYGRSKTANILFAVAFDQRHRGRGVRAAAVHPGGIHTELGRHMDPAQLGKMIEQMNLQLAAEGKAPFQWKTIPQGAATSVWAGFIAPVDEVGGRYCENCHVGTIVPDDVVISAISEGVRGYALDPQNAEALWKKSEELVGEAFTK
jgi:NAD(P)-dependent dehydrogenase (short-subunit alcohol dehydrogenase family)